MSFSPKLPSNKQRKQKTMNLPSPKNKTDPLLSHWYDSTWERGAPSSPPPTPEADALPPGHHSSGCTTVLIPPWQWVYYSLHTTMAVGVLQSSCHHGNGCTTVLILPWQWVYYSPHTTMAVGVLQSSYYHGSGCTTVLIPPWQWVYYSPHTTLHLKHSMTVPSLFHHQTRLRCDPNFPFH